MLRRRRGEGESRERERETAWKGGRQSAQREGPSFSLSSDEQIPDDDYDGEREAGKQGRKGSREAKNSYGKWCSRFCLQQQQQPTDERLNLFSFSLSPPFA